MELGVHYLPLMTILILIAALLVLPGVFGIVAYIRAQARDGYEDDLGFHYGSDAEQQEQL